MTRTEVQLLLTRSSNSLWSLTVTDRRSGVRMVNVELDAEQFSALMASTYGPAVPAEIGDLSKVGLYSEHVQVFVPHGRERDPADNPEVAAAERKAQAEGWTVGMVRANNRAQWVIPLTRWHEQPPKGNQP
jgi:hypothetical protein